jgi:hypothetical protein
MFLTDASRPSITPPPDGEGVFLSTDALASAMHPNSNPNDYTKKLTLKERWQFRLTREKTQEPLENRNTEIEKAIGKGPRTLVRKLRRSGSSARDLERKLGISQARQTLHNLIVSVAYHPWLSDNHTLDPVSFRFLAELYEFGEFLFVVRWRFVFHQSIQSIVDQA